MANNEFIEVLSENAIKDVKTLNRELAKTVEGINRANEASKGLKIPSDFRSAINDLNSIIKQSNSLLKTQVQLQQQLTSSTQSATNTTINAERAERERLRTEQQRIRTQQQQIRLDQQKEAIDRRQQAITDRLGGAYLQLSRAQAAAARRVQDLISTGITAGQTHRQYNRQLREAQREFDKLNSRVLLADRAVGRFNRNVGNYPQKAIMGLKDLLGAFGVVGGVTAFAAITKDIFETTRQLQSLNLALTQVSGSQERAAETQMFLSGVAERYGIEIIGLTRSYTGFLAASQNALDSNKITLRDINQIFESVSKASGAMGLSADQQQRAFLALQQMISKGNVQAEEIRGQLGEALPGAFGILAKSMGVTESQLNKLLKDGKVLAYEVLPAFAKELEKAYGVENIQHVESLAAETSRLKNEWISFVETLNQGDGVISRFFNGFLSEARETVKFYKELNMSDQQKMTGRENEEYKKKLDYLKALNKEQQELQSTDVLRVNAANITLLNQENKELQKKAEILRGLIEDSRLEDPRQGAGMRATYDDQLSGIESMLNSNSARIATLTGQMKAASELLTVEEKVVGNEDSGKKAKAQKADIDYLKEVYQLRKTNADSEIENQERIMNDEEKNYEKRLSAANNYYFQKEKLIELERDEENRLNDLNLKNQTETYRRAISEGKATNSNLQELEYQHILIKERINAEYEQKKNNNAIESAKKLQGVLDSIQDQNLKNQLSKESINDLRQAGLLLSNVGGNTTTAQFAEIENKMRALSNAEEDRQIEAYRIDLRRIQADKERLVNQEGIIENNKAYNELSQKELDVQKQILETENKRKQAVADLHKEMKSATQEYLNGFSQGFLSDSGLGSLSSAFDQVTYEVVNSLGEIETKTGSTFQKLFDQAQTTGEKFAVVFNTVTSVAQEAFAFLQQNQQASFDAMYSRLEREKEINLKFAGESEAGRAEIERQYEERRREIRIKEAKAQKEQAIFNAIINTAQGVTAALAQANIPLSLIIGAIGAAQIALISSRELPAFKDGVQGFGGGLAWVGDGGRSEIIQTPSGALFRTPDTDTLVNLPKGSNVYKDDLDFLRNSGALLGGMPHIELENGGISASDLDAILGRHLSNSTSLHVNLDKKGVNSWASTAHAKKVSHNNRVSFRGRSIN